MTEDPYEPEPPFEYECFECSHRITVEDRADVEDELVTCPECGGELRNVTTSSRE
ncbi:rubrerythrin-like domain-containing protein [Haloplanus sp. GCM10025708]|uniref:rubrerythrin-like domain-containing protein n=1 Tax=Haloferacaceae TaxID=1644056 RepID=UPI00361674DF